MNLAGWARKVSGAASITVGSIGLHGDFLDTLTMGAGATPTTGHIARLEQMIDDGEVDIVAVGRALLADPQCAEKLLNGDDAFIPFTVEKLATLD